MTADHKHPADEIGKALARANGILTLLSSCFDKTNATFETGGNFVYESIVTVETIIENANRALAQLYQTCDLTVIRETAPPPVTQDYAVAEALQFPPAAAATEMLPFTARVKNQQQGQPRFATPAAESGSYLSFFGPMETMERNTERFEPTVSMLADRPAESYDELLQKLTAMADQAAHQSPAERTLVPALENLRADLIKLRSVA